MGSLRKTNLYTSRFLFIVTILGGKNGLLLADPNTANHGCFTRQDLPAKSNGFVDKVFVNDGDLVKKGQTIVELDSKLIKTNVNQAKAGVDVASANFSLAQDGYQRLQLLKSSNAVSDQELFSANIKVSLSMAALANAKALHEQALIQLDYTIIKAARDGQVFGVPHVLGLYVAAGQSLGHIEVKSEEQCAKKDHAKKPTKP